MVVVRKSVSKLYGNYVKHCHLTYLLRNPILTRGIFNNISNSRRFSHFANQGKFSKYTKELTTISGQGTLKSINHIVLRLLELNYILFLNV